MNSYKQIFLNNLDSLSKEISSYKSEEDIWKLTGDISNTPGNLCLHICGSLNHFLGATLGNTGYVRERDKEFSKKNVSREELIKGIDETKQMIEKFFNNLKQEDLISIFPLNQFGENVTVGFVISVMLAHLSYHRGQINYHRRILE